MQLNIQMEKMLRARYIWERTWNSHAFSGSTTLTLLYLFSSPRNFPIPILWGFLRRSSCSHAAAAKSLQLCLTLCDPMDSSPPGSSVHGILQAGILEWVAMSFSHVVMIDH